MGCHSKYVHQICKYYLIIYLSVFLRPVFTQSSLHYKGDLFLVKGDQLLVGSTKILSNMLNSNESWPQNSDVLTNSTWLFKDLVFNLTTDHEHLLSTATGLRRGHDLQCYCSENTSLELFASLQSGAQDMFAYGRAAQHAAEWRTGWDVVRAK